MSTSAPQNFIVKAMRHEVDGVISLDLSPCDGPLPGFTAGAHIDIVLRPGLVRSYSLTNGPEERDRFCIGVLREPHGRGGSAWIHDRLRVGEVVQVVGPRNNFALAEDADRSVFIAGGIGITPFLAMAARLNEAGKAWTLHYSCRSRRSAAFLDRIGGLARQGNGSLFCHFDDEAQGRLLDITSIVARTAPGTHLYCCGPSGMLAAYRAACADHPPQNVHFEYFASEVQAATGGFDVVLAQSGRRIAVTTGETIIDALVAAGISTPHSCLQGVCGACEVRVISGVPDHRDMILDEAERASNRTMMICCSGSLTDELVIDL